MSLESYADVRPAADPIIDNWIQIVRGEYLEIPGLMLTRNQVQHFWGLEANVCDEILGTLVDARFLARTRDGGFVRLDALRV